MGKFIITFVVANFLILACKQQALIVKEQSPRIQFAGLFEAVQSGNIYTDSKTFTDCIPKKSPSSILRDYNQKKFDQDFNLEKFVQKNFYEPVQPETNYQRKVEDIEKHIEELWEVLKRAPAKDNPYSSLINLPFPYVVPGGRFREIYYWDSYFTMLGLAESGKVDMIENMVNNFAWLIRTYGFIPNGNRTYYLTRSQPPYFSLMLRLLAEERGDKADSVIKANRDALEKEYQFWMDDTALAKGEGHVVRMPGGMVLNRYYDIGDWPREEAYIEDVRTARESGYPQNLVYRNLRSGAESGWDFSSRWFKDGKSLEQIETTHILPVDLNCLIYHLEKMLAIACQKDGDRDKFQYYSKLAEARKKAMHQFFWNKETGYFRDYNWKLQQQTSRVTLAGMYPLYFEIASNGQADSVATILKDNFLKPGGLVTSLVNTGQQWDSPNGWAPLQWTAISGLRNYKKDYLAREIADRWSKLNIRVYSKTGKLMEKYNVLDTTLIAGGGEYPTQDGFGWTNGVLMKILKTYSTN